MKNNNNSLEIWIFSFILFLIVLIVVLMTICSTLNKETNELKNKIILLQHKEIIKIDSIPQINDSIVYSLLLEYKLDYPLIVLQQAILESGHFTSNICKEKNNILGMYSEKYKDFYTYIDIRECILAYKHKIQCRRKSNENYYSFLKRIKYCGNDDRYILKLKTMLNNNKTE